jgi:protein SYS1
MNRRKGKMGGQFRNSTWDPILIVSQILALQFVLYSTLGIWNAFTTALVGLPRSLDCLFSYQYIHVRDNSGQLVITSFVLNSLTGYAYIFNNCMVFPFFRLS